MLEKLFGMKGWKTWTAIIGLLLTQVAKLYLDIDITEAESTAATIMVAVQSCLAALGAIGVGHKIEKVGATAGQLEEPTAEYQEPYPKSNG